MRRFAIICLTLLSTVPIASAQLPRVDDQGLIRPRLFPCKFGLEDKWLASVGKPLTRDSVTAFLAEDPNGTQLVKWGDARHLSIWSGLQMRLTGHDKVMTELAESNEGAARALLEARRSTSDLGEIVSISRRFPWASSILQALAEAGERELRRGNLGNAARCFRDVLTRSSDAALRDRVRVGLWIVAAHEPNPVALEAAFQGVDPEAKFPWLGSPTRAADIKARLVGKDTSNVSVELKSLTRQVLDVPSSTSWLYERPGIHREGLSIAGPGMIAWFDGSDTKPVWSKKDNVQAARTLWAPLLSGPFTPSIAQNRLFTRWDNQLLVKTVRGSEMPVNVAAFDLNNGNCLWSTGNNAEWEEICPVNDPVHAEGRVYVLAVNRAEEYSPLFLVCLDAESGSFLWKRELLTYNTTLTGSRVGLGDVVHFNVPVTVAGGSVYCATNMGAVACCDARDGLIEWVRTYPQERGASTLKREGAAPVVHGSRVVIMPRDALGLFALDSATGEMSWTVGDLSLRVLGTSGNTLVLADSKIVRGIHHETGKGLWERNFTDPIDGKATLAGSSVIVGTKAGLVRLDALTGAVAEEQEWGKTGPMAGLAVRGKTLHGANIVPDTRPTTPDEVLTLTGRSVRVVYLAKAIQLDGKTDDWETHQPQDWTGPGDTKGKVLISHDGEFLYLGATASGAGLDVKNGRLELALPLNDKPSRWTLRADAQGKVGWNGDGAMPTGTLSEVRAPLNDKTLTFEIAIPLSSLKPAHDAKDLGPGRLALELTFRCDDPAAKSGSAPMVRVAEGLSLHWLTRTQETAALNMARLLPDMPTSWELLEQTWRLRVPVGTSLAEFYRDFIKQQPRSPGVGQALVRLDRLLRVAHDSNPVSEVLPLAEHAGVPAPIRSRYQKVSSAYLSQWVYVDPKGKPQEIILELFDGDSWGHRVTAGVQGKLLSELLRGARSIRTTSFNGRTTITIDGVRYDPNQLSRKIKGNIIPPPPSGAWHEFKIPLVWLDLHDRPLHGIAFAQVGGSFVYWDRTALILGDKEIFLLDDDTAGGSTLGDWQWHENPMPKSGQKAHSTNPPPGAEMKTRYALVFKYPIRDHLLGGAGSLTVAPAEILALAEQLPGAKLDAYTWSVYERVEAVITEKAKRQLFQTAILSRADVRDLPGWLDRFLRQEYSRGTEKPVESVVALIEASKLPGMVVEEFRKRSRHDFVRTWQVLGPLTKAGSLERDGVQLDREVDGLRWKAMTSITDRIDLSKQVEGKSGFVYLACWIQSPKKQSALLQVGSQDGVSVWFNKSTKTLIEESTVREAAPAQNSARIELVEGWNEVLVRMERHSGPGAIFFEIRTIDNSGPLPGLQFNERMK